MAQPASLRSSPATASDQRQIVPTAVPSGSSSTVKYHRRSSAIPSSRRAWMPGMSASGSGPPRSAIMIGLVSIVSVSQRSASTYGRSRTAGVRDAIRSRYRTLRSAGLQPGAEIPEGEQAILRQDGREGGLVHGPGEEISLGSVTAQCPKTDRLVRRLDPFRRDRELECASEGDGRSDDRCVLGAAAETVD